VGGNRVLLLGCGLQGRAVIEDLEKRGSAADITVADRDTAPAEAWLEHIRATRTSPRRVDLSRPGHLESLLREGFDVVIDMLPVTFSRRAAESAIECGIHLVNTNYAHNLRRLDDVARRRGVTIMAEAGFDPGIDLVLAALARERFDNIETLMSYAGGIPAPEIRDCNPLSYKVSWNFAGVLSTYVRPARVLVEGREHVIEGPDIFRAPWAREVVFDPFGALEAFANGDAVAFLELMDIKDTARNAGRWALRWPGHLAFWEKVSALGLLDVRVDPAAGIAPREYLRRLLEPRLQYRGDERDMTVLRVDAAGRIGGAPRAYRWEMVDYRDPETGLMSMNRTVGYPASITARMILDGTIARRGVCTPARDIPTEPFLRALGQRGITVEEAEIEPDDVIAGFGTVGTQNHFS
jgi:saccharopine dehydrogenase-like NADP-dependent oxidoreductase